MQITGTVHKMLPTEQGTGKTSGKEWIKNAFILKLDGNFDEYAFIEAWGRNADKVDLINPGYRVKVDVNFKSREYNGKWYAQHPQAYNIEIISKPEPLQKTGLDLGNGENEDDLPF